MYVFARHESERLVRTADRQTNIIKPRKRLEVTAISILAEDEAVWVTIEIKALSCEEGDIIR